MSKSSEAYSNYKTPESDKPSFRDRMALGVARLALSPLMEEGESVGKAFLGTAGIEQQKDGFFGYSEDSRAAVNGVVTFRDGGGVIMPTRRNARAAQLNSGNADAGSALTEALGVNPVGPRATVARYVISRLSRGGQEALF